MKYLYTNSNSRSDHLRFEFEKYAKNNEIFIAVPFFSYSQIIKKFIENGCNVKLIVRLCNATSPEALGEIINERNVAIRYFTSRNFHPKLYVFGNEFAIVGSSNLTDSGLVSNQEINVGIVSGDPRFKELKKIFLEYWNVAGALTGDVLKEFGSIESNAGRESEKYENQLKLKIREVNFPNIKRPVEKEHRETIFIENFKKRYQLFLKKFSLLEDIYKHSNLRKSRNENFPLRIEIDNFLSWIRDVKAYGKKYMRAKTKKENELKIYIPKLIKEYVKSDYSIYYVENEIYPEFQKNFSSESAIRNSNINKIYDTLLQINAFSSRFRFFKKGYAKMKKVFLSKNDHDKIKNTICYLLHGIDQYEVRIAKCIHNKNHRLEGFGESCVKELFGWVNKHNIPPCNERTLKSMQWLGFGNLL